MNCLYTLNFNDFMCQNARDSLTAAAQRWGCDYLELRDIDPEVYSYFHKVIGIKKHLMGYERAVFFDADILIRADAPSPFDLFTGNNVYAVRDWVDTWEPPRFKMFKDEVSDPWVIDAHGILGLTCDLTALVATCHEWFFNSGVFIFRPKAIEPEIDYFIAHKPKKRYRPDWEVAKLEQALWNCVLKRTNRIEHVDRKWNFIEPDLGSGKMAHYVYHFTGTTCQWLKQMLKDYDWKSVPQVA